MEELNKTHQTQKKKLKRRLLMIQILSSHNLLAESSLPNGVGYFIEMRPQTNILKQKTLEAFGMVVTILN